MRVIKSITGDLTTDASGDASHVYQINGKIIAIRLDYSASADAGTDITITNDLSETVYSKTDSKTDVTLRPRTPVEDNAGTDVTYDGSNEIYEPYSAAEVTVTIAQGGASVTDNVLVTFHVEAIPV